METGEIREIKELVRISRYSGMREDLVQAGGGNSSVKLDGCRMAIKSSGVQLADVTETMGYSVVDYAMIRSYMEAIANGFVSSSDRKILEKSLLEGRRPSIETFLHAVTGRVTLHTHPVSVNVLASRAGGMERIGELFPEVLLVGYATPGLELAKRYYRTYMEAVQRGQKKIVAVFLKNHGLIVSGDTAKEVIRLTEQINETAEKETGLDNSAYRRAYELYECFEKAGAGEGKIVVKAENRYVLDAFEAFGYRLWDYRICPDCVVFCGRAPFDFTGPAWEERLKEHIGRYGTPVMVTYGTDLFIRAESVRKAREIESVLAMSARAAMANRGFRVDILPDGEQDFLLGWDAERYRQAMK